MDITGTIKVIGETQQVSDKFKKREFVLTDNTTQYPQHISFQLTQDKCGLIDKYNVGSEIKVHFNLRGREYQPKEGGAPKYFNSLEAWRLEDGKNMSPSEAYHANNNNTNDVSGGPDNGQDDQDLPF